MSEFTQEINKEIDRIDLDLYNAFERSFALSKRFESTVICMLADDILKIREKTWAMLPSEERAKKTGQALSNLRNKL